MRPHGGTPGFTTTLVAISMISGGSRSFAIRERQVLFQSRKFQKWVWSVLFMG